MKLGKISHFFTIFILIFFQSLSAEDKIISTPIINLENLEPSYETLENEKENILQSNTEIKKRNNIEKNNYSEHQQIYCFNIWGKNPLFTHLSLTHTSTYHWTCTDSGR